MTLSREMDCRLAILRALIEAWEEGVDRNLSWFNQLGKTVAQVSSRIAESAEIPSPQPSPRGRGSLFAVRRELWVGTVLLPLLLAEASPLVQAARQDAERAALGHGRPIAACRWTRG